MADDELKCPKCGEKVYATDDRCMGCGVVLDTGELVPPRPLVAGPGKPAATTGGE